MLGVRHVLVAALISFGSAFSPSQIGGLGSFFMTRQNERGILWMRAAAARANVSGIS
jgi:hypothetical protein